MNPLKMPPRDVLGPDDAPYAMRYFKKCTPLVFWWLMDDVEDYFMRHPKIPRAKWMYSVVLQHVFNRRVKNAAPD